MSNFDVSGMLAAIDKAGQCHKLPLPNDICFCSICLGANVPNQKEYPEGGWRCGI